MKNKNILISVVLSAFMISACSSIVSKSEYSVAINSDPEGANFQVTNRLGHKIHQGVTPASVTLKSSSEYFEGEIYTIVFNKDGYSTKTYTLTSSLDGWYWGNILLGGLIGMLIVDPITGAMYKLPDRVDVSIDSQSISNRRSEDLTIATIDTLTKDQISRLERIQ